MPPLDGATEWLNSEPLDPAGLRGNVVLVNFWTLTCINWLRQAAVRPRLVAGLPRRRAGRDRRPHAGVLVRARHRRRARRRRRTRASTTRSRSTTTTRSGAPSTTSYWPALYFVDADGVIRDHHFGEGRYEQSERVIQRLLGVERELVPVEGVGVEARGRLGRTCGRPRPISATGAASASPPRTAPYSTKHAPTSSPSACASTTGRSPASGRSGARTSCSTEPGGSIAFRFHARDAHLVLAPGASEPIPFRVLARRRAARAVTRRRRRRGRQRRAPRRRLYQLVREHDAVRERTLEITFLEPGAEAYAFTFG